MYIKMYYLKHQKKKKENNIMFIEDKEECTTIDSKNQRLSDLLRTMMRDKSIKIITRIDNGTHGWQFEFNS